MHESSLSLALLYPQQERVQHSSFGGCCLRGVGSVSPQTDLDHGTLGLNSVALRSIYVLPTSRCFVAARGRNESLKGFPTLVE